MFGIAKNLSLSRKGHAQARANNWEVELTQRTPSHQKKIENTFEKFAGNTVVCFLSFCWKPSFFHGHLSLLSPSPCSLLPSRTLVNVVAVSCFERERFLAVKELYRTHVIWGPRPLILGTWAPKKTGKRITSLGSCRKAVGQTGRVKVGCRLYSMLLTAPPSPKRFSSSVKTLFSRTSPRAPDTSPCARNEPPRVELCGRQARSPLLGRAARTCIMFTSSMLRDQEYQSPRERIRELRLLEC